jgi:ABC-type transport system involved in multi-copper enzyme maturation permease subunit
MTQEPGMIFGWYGNLLDKIPDFLAAPLGKCPYCNGFWIFAIAFFLYWSDPKTTFIPTLILLFLGAGINYIWTRVIGKIISEDTQESNVNVKIEIPKNQDAEKE